MRESMEDIFYSRPRLAIVAELLQMEWVSFTDLQTTVGVTRGNLASHLSKLIAAGVVEDDKRILNRRPLTRYRLTRKGRAAFLKHMVQVQQIFEAVAEEYGEAEIAALARSQRNVKKPVLTENT
jgi:predicted ArsR family transcriptional regulator